MTLNLNDLETLISWKSERDQNIKSRLMLSRDMALTIVHPPKSALGRLWQKIVSFFGGNDLKKVAQIANRIIESPIAIPADKKEELQKALTLLKAKVHEYNKHSIVRPKIDDIKLPADVVASKTQPSATPQQQPHPMRHVPIEPQAPAHGAAMSRQQPLRLSKEKDIASSTSPQPTETSQAPRVDIEGFPIIEDLSSLEDVAQPLVGKRGTPSEVLVREHEKDSLTSEDKKALQALDHSFDAQLIKGDGHCMFRALLVALTAKYSPKELSERLDAAVQVAMLSEEFQATSKDDTIKEVKEFIEKLRAGTLHIEDTDMGKNAEYCRYMDSSILLLRRLAIAWWRQQPQQEILDLVPMIKEEGDINPLDLDHLQERFDGMQKLGPHMYGSQIELKALCSLFNVHVGVLSYSMLKRDPDSLTVNIFGPSDEITTTCPSSKVDEKVKGTDLLLIHDSTNQHFQVAFLKP